MRALRLVILLLPLVLSACSMKDAGRNMKIDVMKVHVTEATMDGVKALVTVQVYNANWFGVTVAGARYRVIMNGRDIGGGRFDREVDIPSEKTITADVPLEVGPDGVTGVLAYAIKGSRLKYYVKGEADLKTWLGTYTMPFDTQKKDKGV